MIIKTIKAYRAWKRDEIDDLPPECEKVMTWFFTIIAIILMIVALFALFIFGKIAVISIGKLIAIIIQSL